jgi:peptidyl-tRNA hydrolase, PTH1 family
MHAVICLGNPGSEYAATRHNVGFRVADYLSTRYSLPLGRNRLRATFGRGQIAGHDALLIKPQTFMNDSGDAARRVCAFFNVPAEDVIAVYDEMALELGVVRVRPGGSDAGHKGMRSLAAHLGTREIARVRLGVGGPPPGADARDWVLSEFKPWEREKVEEMVARAAEAVASLLTDGMERTMSRFNG